jgi:hypothetical protein
MSIRRKFISATLGLTLLVPAIAPIPAAARSEVGGAPLEVASSYNPAVSEFVAVAPTNQAVPAGYEQVADTASLRLHINRSNSKIIVEDKRSGKLWTSNPLEALGEQKTILDDAVFQINYTNARRQMTNLASSASETPKLIFQSIPNGVRVNYELEKLKIKLTIDYAIKEEARVDVPGTIAYLEVTVPNDGLKEEGDCAIATSTTCAKITSLEVLPLFGAAPSGAEGYLMIPDGVGSIVRFKHETAQYRQRYSQQIYGTDAAGAAFTTGGGQAGAQRTSQSTRVWLPLWGLKSGDNAYAGIVTKGEFQANINAYMAGYITNANRASTEFIYRRQASIPRRRTLFVNRIEDDWMRGDRQVRYVLLNGEDANYSGMAKAFRNYLMKDQGVKRLPMEAPRPFVEFYQGITRRASFREDFVPMTTFDQAIKITQAFLDNGVTNLDVLLNGWNDDGDRGRWPRRYPAEEDLGGNAGLRRFTNFAQQNGVRTFLHDNYVFGYLGSSGGIFGQIPYIRNLWPNWSYGFNSRWDTVRGVNKLPVSFGSRGAWQVYLINPVFARTSYAERDIPVHKSFNVNGISLANAGRFVWSDTNERHPLNRQEAAAEFMKKIELSKQLLGDGIVQGGNSYVLPHVNRVVDAPELALDAFGDTPVPVYHIATQGLVHRMVWAPNMRNDQRTEFLRQIEYGMQPHFVLTHQPSADLIRTNVTRYYSTQYTDWLEPAVKEYKQMRDEFGYLAGQFVVKHEILQEHVHRVTYEDGSQLTVNHTAQPYLGSDGTISAYSYSLRKGPARP